jgi:hypothetical protein
MQSDFQAGMTVFIIESNIHVREATIVKKAGTFYTIRFESGGGITVRESRLFRTKEDAEHHLSKKNTVVRRSSPYDYMH